MKDVFIINVLSLSCPLLCAVTSSIYIIITTFTFVLRLLITSQIVSILITIIIIANIIIIIITIIIIKINPPLTFKACKVMFKSSVSMLARFKSAFKVQKEWND